MRAILIDIPIQVIVRDDVGLLGAARFAALSEGEKQERKAA